MHVNVPMEYIKYCFVFHLLVVKKALVWRMRFLQLAFFLQKYEVRLYRHTEILFIFLTTTLHFALSHFI